MLDVLPKLLIELREDADVAAIAGANPSQSPARVRGLEPAPGDLESSGEYRAFVVITTLDSPRMNRAPIQRPQIGGRAYGRTKEEAFALYMACSDAIHHLGPRLHANGLGIYLSHDSTGGSQAKDPDTQQPYVDFTVALIATTQAVTN